jgi:hypothetical protein
MYYNLDVNDVCFRVVVFQRWRIKDFDAVHTNLCLFFF